jgi:hypothetical protein
VAVLSDMTSELDGLRDHLLLDANNSVCLNIKIDHATAADYRICSYSTRANYHGPTRYPGACLYYDVAVARRSISLSMLTCKPEVVGSCQQKNIYTEKNVFADVDAAADSANNDVC